jgi:PAS domain S-box-containing protein
MEAFLSADSRLSSQNVLDVLHRESTSLICIHEPETRKIIYASDAAKRMLGYDSSELIGRELYEFVDPEFMKNINDSLFRRMLYNSDAVVKIMLSHKDGKSIWAESKWTQDLIEFEGLEGCGLTVVSDVTESVSMMQDLVQAWSKEKEIEEMRSNILAIASHEVKNPLAVIQGQLDILEHLIKQKNLNDTFEGVVKKTQSQINRLNEIINDIVKFRHTRMSDELFSPEDLDLIELITEAIEKVRGYGEERNIVFKHSGKEQTIQADRVMMGYIFSNLLDNAVKYSQTGDEIKVKLSFQPRVVICRVEDTGIGIPKDAIDKVFEPFFRASNAANFNQGTGVALAIVKQFTSLHGGSIKIESQLNEGTAIQLDLPYTLFN